MVSKLLISPSLIDLIQQSLACQKALHVVDNEAIMALPEAICNSGSVRRDEDVIEGPERRVSRQGFLIEDIERCASDTAVLQSVEQGGFVDQRPSGDVDQVSVGLHFAQ